MGMHTSSGPETPDWLTSPASSKSAAPSVPSTATPKICAVLGFGGCYKLIGYAKRRGTTDGLRPNRLGTSFRRTGPKALGPRLLGGRAGSRWERNFGGRCRSRGVPGPGEKSAITLQPSSAGGLAVFKRGIRGVEGCSEREILMGSYATDRVTSNRIAPGSISRCHGNRVTPNSLSAGNLWIGWPDCVSRLRMPTKSHATVRGPTALP